jgi:Predicted membrane protein
MEKSLKRVIIFSAVIQLSLLALIMLEITGINLSLFRQIVGFVYLTFIPGTLLISILKPRKFGSIEILLCIIGLSLSFMLFFGVILNFLLPPFGLTKPISLWPLLSGFMIVTSSLTLVACKFGKGFNIVSKDKPIKNYLINVYNLLPVLIPVLAILSALIAFNYRNNYLILINYSLMIICVLILVFKKNFSTELYPLYLFSISLGILWTHSLISNDIVGGDIQLEYITLSTVISNSFWDMSIHTNLNAMLSVTIMPPVYSIILDLSPAWVLKIIYSFLFSLVPLALFSMYRNFFSEKISFLASFFFISFPAFFFEIVELSRQEIAEFFIVISLLLIFSKSDDFLKKNILLLIFLFSIVVSHYTSAYLYLIVFGSYILLLFLMGKDNINNLFKKFKIKLKYHGEDNFNIISVTYVLIFFTFAMGWYIYVSQSSSLESVVKIGDSIVTSIQSDFFSSYGRDPFIMQALGLEQMRSSEIGWQIARYAQYITQFLIIVGVYGLLTKYRQCFNRSYLSLVLVNLLLILLTIILPNFASKINMTRIFHICLFILSPFCILGGLMIFQFLSRVIFEGFNALTRKVLTRISSLKIFLTGISIAKKPSTENFLKLITVLILIPYFLLSTGFIFEVTGETPTSMPLSLYKADWPFHTESEIQACNWLNGAANNNGKVYGDWYGAGFVGCKVSKVSARNLMNNTKIEGNSFIFLRSWNIENGTFYIPTYKKSGLILDYVSLTNGYYYKFLNKNDLVYDNGGSKFFYLGGGN